MSESADSIARLRAAGLNMEDIGQAIGRNRSLVRQVAMGAKPGNNLRDALARLEQKLEAGTDARQAAREGVAPPPRRQAAGGRPARVRRPVSRSGAGWSTATARRQATRSGGGALDSTIARAAARGHQLAVDATVAQDVKVANAYGKHGVAGFGGTAEMVLGDAQDVLDELRETGQDFTSYVYDRLVERGDVDGGREPGDALVQLELRSF